MGHDHRNGIVGGITGGISGSFVGTVAYVLYAAPPVSSWIGLVAGAFIGACMGTIGRARPYRDESTSYRWLLDSIAEGSAAGLVVGGAVTLLLWGPCWVYREMLHP